MKMHNKNKPQTIILTINNNYDSETKLLIKGAVMISSISSETNNKLIFLSVINIKLRWLNTVKIIVITTSY